MESGQACDLPVKKVRTNRSFTTKYTQTTAIM